MEEEIELICHETMDPFGSSLPTSIRKIMSEEQGGKESSRRFVRGERKDDKKLWSHKVHLDKKGLKNFEKMASLS